MVRFPIHYANGSNSLLGSANVATIQTKITGVRGRCHLFVHRLRCQNNALATLSSRSGAVDSATSVAPTRRDRPKVGIFCGSEGAKGPAVSGKSRQKRLHQIQLITGTYPGVVL